MPYADPEARRASHRRSDIRNRARVLAYRKRRRLETRYDRYGGELGYLMAQQRRDDERDKLGFPVKYSASIYESDRAA